MDLNYPPEAEEFRAIVQEWLAANLPADWAPTGPGQSVGAEARRRFNETWNEKLVAGGWICPTWPVEYGGKGLATMEAFALAEEFERAGVPLRADFFGDTLVGPRSETIWGGTAEIQRNIVGERILGLPREPRPS